MVMDSKKLQLMKGCAIVKYEEEKRDKGQSAF